MPSERPAPPVVAESGDPFAPIRVIDLLARVPRAAAIPIGTLVDRLNASHVDWLFDERVVADVVLQLQANWMADYRNTSGREVGNRANRHQIKQVVQFQRFPPQA